MPENLLMLATENPVHTMIFLITFYMWYCIFDRLIVYAGLFRRNSEGERSIAVLTRERIMSRGSSAEVELNIIGRMISRNLSVIKVSTVIAPMLGLLGTVWGMLITFNIISDNGTGDPALMSDGISKALTSTRLGLTATVFGMLMAAVLERMRRKLTAYAGAESIRNGRSVI
ncbi:MotA/TolQ/ExbB proton channel [Denitrovibrio acetiphilus DSM 12809]|uniref:MotA/TolQ/ExbB proton channel n=2 Tax=Denitrovibrio TaxID=117999 RepID=D4H699_DENA2|nr:MotA/TolQ/ExbB proton channel [Denitrovibrio acetiphilus DSM 12809]